MKPRSLKPLRIGFLGALWLLPLAVSPLPAKEPAVPVAVDQTENVRNYIRHSDFVVDICIYEQEWIPATPEFPKARLVKRAVVTGVHKGDIPVGTKLEYEHLVEEPPRLFKAFRSVVDGELRTFFFSRSDGTLNDGKYVLKGDGHFSFDRIGSDFAAAFRKERRHHPELQRQNE